MNANQKKLFSSKRKNQRGQTMTEYAIIVALIALISIVAIRTLGEQTTKTFENMGTELQNANEAYESGGE